tara:strand:+ start:600 stop:947 length:348 start_codon:yes stop_codon:yes gene_type:complete
MEKSLRLVRNAKVMEMHLEGCSYRDIGREFGISKSIAHKIVKSNTSSIEEIKQTIKVVNGKKEVIKTITISQIENSQGRKTSFVVDGFEEMEVLGILQFFKRDVEKKIMEIYEKL